MSLRWKYTIVVNAALAATAAAFVLAHRLGYWPDKPNAIIAAVGVAVGALALVIGAGYRSFVLRPLNEILHVTGKLAEGETGKRIEVAAGDEFASIASAVNSLVAQEEQRTAELKNRYVKSTESLREAIGAVRTRAEQSTDMHDRIAEVDRRKAEFLTNVSHELRTPLTSIRGFLKLLEEELYDDEEERQEFFEAARLAAEHMLAVLDGQLTAARLDRDELEPAKTPLDGFEVASNVLRILEGRSRGGDVDVFLDGQGTALADERLLRQVLLNLVGNALKFTDFGSVTVRITENDDTVRFEIEDTGAGIEPEDIDRIFEPFLQADEAASRAQGGTGLGLSVSRQLVRLMGGEMGVRSDGAGHGASFHFTLPAAARTLAV